MEDPQVPGSELTRRLIEQIAAGESGAKLCSLAVARHPGASREEAEEAFHEACLLAYRSCRGRTEGEVFSWLRTTTERELGHARRRAWRRGRVELVADVAQVEALHDCRSVPSREAELIEAEDQAEVERAARSVLTRLSERQRAVAVLHCHGHKRAEIAAHLGLSPRAVKRAVEQTLRVGREELARLAGHGCTEGEGLVTRLAFGLASVREARQARAHLDSCPRCRVLYARLDAWREKVAVLLPLPAAEPTSRGLIERALHGAADGLSTAGRHVGDTAAAARAHVTDGATQLKQHATGAYLRVADPSPLAGVRPGAAAAAIAGCLAIGGGATYCAEQDVNPIHGVTAFVLPEPERKRPAAPRKHRRTRAKAQPSPAATAAKASSTPAPPEPTPQPQPAATPAPAPQPTPQPTPEPTPPPAPAAEYEPIGQSASAAPAPRSTSAAAPTQPPAPAPAGGPGEFDGP